MPSGGVHLMNVTTFLFVEKPALRKAFIQHKTLFLR